LAAPDIAAIAAAAAADVAAAAVAAPASCIRKAVRILVRETNIVGITLCL